MKLNVCIWKVLKVLMRLNQNEGHPLYWSRIEILPDPTDTHRHARTCTDMHGHGHGHARTCTDHGTDMIVANVVLRPPRTEIVKQKRRTEKAQTHCIAGPSRSKALYFTRQTGRFARSDTFRKRPSRKRRLGGVDSRYPII